MAATRFSVPTPQADVPIATYKENFSGLALLHQGGSGDRARWRIAFQILMPGFNYDLARAGQGPVARLGVLHLLQLRAGQHAAGANASQNDKDFIAAVNWKQAEQCVAQGKAKTWPTRYAHNWMDEADVAHSEMLTGTKVLEPADCPGMVYYLPTPSRRTAWTSIRRGEYIVAGGKLATVIPVHSFTRCRRRSPTRRSTARSSGIPVLKYEAVIACEVKEPGLGPLHTEFDGKGNAYTSMFLSSEIVKWRLKDCTVLDRIPTYYSIGHLMIPGGDTRKP